MRSILIIFTLFVLAAAPLSGNESLDKSCREHPRLVGKCFRVHGRLSVYNGAPALRIWKTGTKRVLGISEQRFAEPGYRNVPEDVAQKINQDVDLVGDYLVCPFTHSQPKEMQLVCIERGDNIHVTKHH